MVGPAWEPVPLFFFFFFFLTLPVQWSVCQSVCLCSIWNTLATCFALCLRSLDCWQKDRLLSYLLTRWQHRRSFFSLHCVAAAASVSVAATTTTAAAAGQFGCCRLRREGKDIAPSTAVCCLSTPPPRDSQPASEGEEDDLDVTEQAWRASKTGKTAERELRAADQQQQLCLLLLLRRRLCHHHHFLSPSLSRTPTRSFVVSPSNPSIKCLSLVSAAVTRAAATAFDLFEYQHHYQQHNTTESSSSSSLSSSVLPHRRLRRHRNHRQFIV